MSSSEEDEVISAHEEESGDEAEDAEAASSVEENEPEEDGEEEAGGAEKSFKELGLCDALCEACERVNWRAPTKVQLAAIPPALDGRDVIALAETGSGKTGAFALPILQNLMQNPQRNYALVLSPTRELAIQIAEHFSALGSSIGLSVAVIVGGVDMASQAITLAKRPHVIVATPGRLVSKLERASWKNPVKVEISASKYQTVDRLKQYYMFIPFKYKEAYLVHVLNEKAGNSVIIFCATCASVMKTGLMLRHLGFTSIALHGQMNQPARIGALNKFKSKDCSVEVYQSVEANLGSKLPAYLARNEDVMPLVEHVSQAMRQAAQKYKESNENGAGAKRRGGGGRGDEDDRKPRGGKKGRRF
ncbi:RNA helicase [Aphelenchoides fujianensis]|nr:RNA helicase [Aphelenchoides fujianensis]